MIDSVKKIVNEMSVAASASQDRGGSMSWKFVRDWETRLRAIESLRGGGVRLVRFVGIDPLHIGAGAIEPMLRESWRFAFSEDADGVLRFAFNDDGPLVAAAAITTPELPEGEGGEEVWWREPPPGTRFLSEVEVRFDGVNTHGWSREIVKTSQPAAAHGEGAAPVGFPAVRDESEADDRDQLQFVRGYNQAVVEARESLRFADRSISQPAAAHGWVTVPRETVERWSTAFPVLRNTLKAADLAGAEIAEDFLAELKQALATAAPQPQEMDRERVMQQANFRAACYALVGIVEGVQGLGRRWAANGERLKDTPEWVKFYVAVADMRDGKLSTAREFREEIGTNGKPTGYLLFTPPASGGVDAVTCEQLINDPVNGPRRCYHKPVPGSTWCKRHRAEGERGMSILPTPSPTSARELPELPEPDGQISVMICGQWIDIDAYRASTVRAYALQAREGK